METTVRQMVLGAPTDDENPFTHTLKTLKSIIKQAKRGAKPFDYIGLTFVNTNDISMEVNLEFRHVKELAVDSVLNEINSIAQSNRAFSNEGIMKVTATRVIMPEGRGIEGNVEKNRKKVDIHKCLIKTNNNNAFHRSTPADAELKRVNSGYKKTVQSNNFCGIYAAEIGMKHKIKIVENTSESLRAYNEAKRQDTRAFAQRVDQIMDICGLDLSERGMIRRDWAKLQEHFQNFRFVVYEDTDESKIIFEGKPPNPYYGLVTICLVDGHYSYCLSNKSLFNFKYECPDCGVRYTAKNSHNCVKPCYRCGHVDCGGITKGEIIMSCRKCYSSFKTQICYENHLKRAPKAENTKCALYRKCLKCGHAYLKSQNHTCGTAKCFNCHLMKPIGHKCFVQIPNILKRSLKGKIERTFITAYDAEATQCRKMDNGRYMHELNVICSSTMCHVCMDKPDLKTCSNCGVREKTFTKFQDPNANVAKNFITWAKQKARGEFAATKRMKNRVHILIGHYAGAYDNLFLVAEASGCEEWNFVTMINRGRKILKGVLKCEDVTIVLLDFYNYVSKSLSSLCAAFDLDPNLSKGNFPHRFNIPENWNYSKAEMPPKENWCPEAMNVVAREKFLKWWLECDNELKRTGKEWNFQREIISYCKLDTCILQKSLVKFCAEMRKLGVEPLHENFTLAALCLQVYSRKFMGKDTIGNTNFILVTFHLTKLISGIIPKNGYRLRDTQSKAAIRWMLGEENKLGITIQHAGRGEERKISGIGVDGYYKDENGVEYVWQVRKSLFLMNVF